MCSWRLHIIQDKFWNTYTALANFLEFALFQTLRTKWDFINILYIALFQIHRECDCTVPHFWALILVLDNCETRQRTSDTLKTYSITSCLTVPQDFIIFSHYEKFYFCLHLFHFLIYKCKFCQREICHCHYAISGYSSNKLSSNSRLYKCKLCSMLQKSKQFLFQCTVSIL
jgi:hypothetical protein